MELGHEGAGRGGVGAEEVCEGLDLAVAKMKKGERAEITLAPQWAFGAAGATKPLAPVPPNAAVTYEVGPSRRHPTHAAEAMSAAAARRPPTPPPLRAVARVL